MDLLDIVNRRQNPIPWAEGEKIPWHDPAFSRRMLQEHLSQEHDAASRRFATIDEHVAWIHEQLLAGKPTQILDLGCGPGFYTYRLAALGHQCMGIDFSPASIAFATAQAEQAGLDCTYREQDIRTAAYGSGYGLVMLIFGELNVFRPEEARHILEQAYHALAPGGLLLLEPHTHAQIVALGQEAASWSTATSGLFSATPHLYLQENGWDEQHGVAITRYYIVDATTTAVTLHSSSMQAYTDEAYQSLLNEVGFGDGTWYSALGQHSEDLEWTLPAIVARKQKND